MPGSEGLRLPVVQRTIAQYSSAFEQAGFRHRADEVYPTDQIRRAKPGLRQAGDAPLALLFDCASRVETTY